MLSFFYSYAFLILYGIALATEVWGVIASLIMNPPFVGAGVSATTLVIAFSFAVSRPCLTLKVGNLLQLVLVRFRTPFFI